MPKQRWTPPDDQVAAKLDAVVELYEKWQWYEAEYKRQVAEAIDPQGEWKIPVARVADRIDVERKTVYRHAGRSMT